MAEQSRLDVSRDEWKNYPDIGIACLARLGGSIARSTRSIRSSIDDLRRVEQRLDRRFETVDRKMDDLRAELSKQFRWTFSTMLALLGMMLTVGAGVATALLRN